MKFSEDQVAQLLSAFWVQANLPDNLPSNIEAIAHSYCLTLISLRLKVEILVCSSCLLFLTVFSSSLFLFVKLFLHMYLGVVLGYYQNLKLIYGILKCEN